jgi:type II secretory ATPase GspE/PulE/Tfp pilus assembly ATPase PilB-like protein
VVKKIFGFFTAEKESKASKEKNANEELKNIYGWENIKFTMRNIRRQIFELIGMKDPWWDYSQEQKGMDKLEQQALGNGSQKIANDNAVQVPGAHAEKGAEASREAPHEERKAA